MVDRGTVDDVVVLVVVDDRGTVDVVVMAMGVVLVTVVAVVGKPGMPPESSTNTWSRQRPLPLPVGAVPKRCANSIANDSRPSSLRWIRSSRSKPGSAAVAAAQSTMVTLG